MNISSIDRRRFIKSLGAAGILLSVPDGLLARNSPGNFFPESPNSLLRDLVDAALRNGATYADARFVSMQQQSIQVRKDMVYSLNDTESSGLALRVYKNRAWGFSAHGLGMRPDIKRMAADACSMAGSLAGTQTVPFREGGRAGNMRENWSTPFKTDPFAVPLKEKCDFLLDLATFPISNKMIAYSVANLFSTKRRVQFFNSKDAEINQTFIHTYPNFGMTAFDGTNGRIDSRSTELEALATGYEITESHPFRDEMQQAIDELTERQKAPPVKEGVYDLILTPSHLWRLLYETLALHMDPNRIHGLDGGNPGHRLVQPGDIGSLRIAGPELNVRFDNTLEQGLGSFGWDDSGRKASSGNFIREGVPDTIPGSDEHIANTAQPSGLTTRAYSWQSVPRFAMPNLVLVPGQSSRTLEDMIADTEKGILLSGRGRTTISSDQSWFRSNSQMAWLLEKGKITGMVRDLVFEAPVLDFWKSLVDVGGKPGPQPAGDMFSQNINPLWELPFSVSTPPARFMNINVLPSTGEKK